MGAGCGVVWSSRRIAQSATMPFVKREGGGGAVGESSGVGGGMSVSLLVLAVVCDIRWAIQMCACSQQGSSVARGVSEGSSVRVPAGDMV